MAPNTSAASGGGVLRGDPVRVCAGHAGRTTTRRCGSSPSDSLRTPVDLGHRVVDDLALERRHRRQPLRLTRSRRPAAAVRRPSAASSSRRRARWPPMSSISRLRAPVSRVTASRVSSCSASSVDAILADELRQVGADDRHRGPSAFDVDVDVAVEVGDVEQRLEVVGRDVPLALEQRQVGLVGRRPPRRIGVGLVEPGSSPGSSSAVAVAVPPVESVTRVLRSVCSQ